MMHSRRLIGLCLLCLGLLLPFAFRPLHIDDPMFVWAAQHITAHPEDFYGFTVNWEGIPRPMARIFPIPPQTSYVLAGVSRVVGWNVPALHLAFLPFSIATVIGFYFLAGQFCRRPGLAGALLILCPAFWVSATSLMCEIPLLCFWIWTILFWTLGSQKSQWFFLPAGLFLLLAVLTKLTALGLIPLLAFQAILNRSNRSILLPQAVTLLLVAAACVYCDSVFARLYGIGAFANAEIYSINSRAILNIPAAVRLLNTLAFVGGCGFIACLVLVGVIWRPRAQLLFAVSILLTAYLLTSSSQNSDRHEMIQFPHSFAFYFQYALLLGFAVALIIFFSRSFARACRSGKYHDEAFLLVWIVGIFIFAGFLNWSINARSILPMVPAICILVVRGLDRFNRLPPIRTAVTLCAGGIIAMQVTIGDYHLAAAAKTAADLIHQQAIATLAADSNRSNAKFYLAGHWGLQYYLQPLGFTELDITHPQFKPGDYVLFPSNGFGGVPRADGFELAAHFSIAPGPPVATQEPSIGAGFYHSDGYELPFVFAPTPAQEFALVKATRDSHVYP